MFTADGDSGNKIERSSTKILISNGARRSNVSFGIVKREHTWYILTLSGIIYSRFALKNRELVESMAVDCSGHVTVLPGFSGSNLDYSTGIHITEVSFHEELL